MPIDPALIDVTLPDHDGYPPEVAAEDTAASLREAAAETAREFPDHLWIEPRDWREKAEQAKLNRLRPIDFIDRFTNQGSGPGIQGTHECTTHALRAVYEAARNRQRRITLGPPVAGTRLAVSAGSASVFMSCLSIYAEANPRKWGGASTRGVLEIATRRGFLPDKTQPRDWGFEHDLIGTNGKGGVNQSRGSWVKLSDFPDGWKETAKHFRPLEIVFPRSWEEIVCLLIHGFAVGIGREGHAIPYSEWMYDDEVTGYVDSYDVIRYDSIRMIKRGIGSAYSIITTTTPDDWERPAG